MGLYVETRVRVEPARLWERTQRPDLHQRWDLRFTHIHYLPSDDAGPRRFRYATRVFPGVVVDGVGVSAGERRRPDGTSTSALRFRSPHPLSPLAEGSGYWRYVPAPGGVRFLTGYDYSTRWGPVGRVVDRALFRPLMGWATAWSFDRLRLWCERGITPERALARGLAEVAVRAVVVAAALCTGSLALTAAALLAACVVPPLPGTPAARRCLRRRPAGTRGTPSIAASLRHHHLGVS